MSLSVNGVQQRGIIPMVGGIVAIHCPDCENISHDLAGDDVHEVPDFDNRWKMPA